METKILNWLILILLFLGACKAKDQKVSEFVRVQDGKFFVQDKEYAFLGTNYWQGMNLGATLSGDRSRLVRELDHLQSMGITNLRVLAGSEGDSTAKYCILPALQYAAGEYNDEVFEGLDFLLAEMSKRQMKAVMVLGNFWTWSGGFPQYLEWASGDSIPYPQEVEHTWDEFCDYSKRFYLNKNAQRLMENHVERVVNRKNSLNGILYKDDPTIMSWQLANEPRGYDLQSEYHNWIKNVAGLIKRLDKNHLVSLGSEGNTAGKNAGTDVYSDNAFPEIDYVTMHIWVQNWGWFIPGQNDSIYNEAINKVESYWAVHAEAAKKLNKPLVLEEFGIARDEASFLPTSSINDRDRYYNFILNKVAQSILTDSQVKGANFWSFSGEGRPPRPGEYWQFGDPFLGDPPHELQGWYGVYNTDTTTLSVIVKNLELIKNKN